MRSCWLQTLALVALGATACRPRGGTDVGNGATASFDLGAYRPAAVALSIHEESHVKVETFLLAVGDFRLRRGTECGASEVGKLVLQGPVAGDLVQEDAAEESERVDLVPGAHCALRASAVSIFVSGTRGDGVAFTVVLDRELKLDLLSPAGKPIQLRDSSAFVLAFDVDAAIAALELEAVEDAPIRVDSRTHSSRLSAFANSLRRSASLFVDEDEDGVLDDDESVHGKSVARGHL